MKYLQVNFPEAIEDYTEALKFKSRLAAAYYNRGLIHYRLGEHNFLQICFSLYEFWRHALNMGNWKKIIVRHSFVVTILAP